jgi:DNA-binding transcriptional LysR family regulator
VWHRIAGVDFRHLRSFIAVAEELSVTKAAARLHISQPPLSRQIQQLEQEVGVTLFVRHRHGVTLTSAGQRLLDKARTLTAAAADFYETASEAARDHSNRVRLGIAWGLWDAVNRIRVETAKRPGTLTIDANDFCRSEQINEKLRDGLLDVAISRRPFEGDIVEAVSLFQERVVVALSDSHPLAGRKSIRIEELAGETLLLWDRHLMPSVYEQVLDIYRVAGVKPEKLATPGVGPHNLAGMMMVASGRGVYVCIGVPFTSPRGASGVAVVPISNPEAIIDVCVAWRREDISPAMLQFLECVWRVFPRARPDSVSLVRSARL